MGNIEDTVELDAAGQYDLAAESSLSSEEIALLRLRTNGPRDVLAVEYLARADDDTLICVTRPPTVHACSDYRFFIGAGSPLREVEVVLFDRFRNGMTTVETAEGTFAPRRPFEDPHAARFNDRAFTMMDAAGMDAVIEPAGLVLR